MCVLHYGYNESVVNWHHQLATLGQVPLLPARHDDTPESYTEATQAMSRL